MTSCRIFSCDSCSTVNPMRLAGTWSRYSKNASPQLTPTATSSGAARRLRRCAYQANVMKTLEQMRSRIDWARGDIGAMLTHRAGSRFSLCVGVREQRRDGDREPVLVRRGVLAMRPDARVRDLD